jgi:hypothetical protein
MYHHNANTPNIAAVDQSFVHESAEGAAVAGCRFERHIVAGQVVAVGGAVTQFKPGDGRWPNP